MITPQVFALTLFLATGWGTYFVYTVFDYHRVRVRRTRRRGELVRAFRLMIVALCVWMLPLSFFVRTGLVLLGLGEGVAGQVLFFALAGTNVVGVIFTLISLVRDDAVVVDETKEG